MATLSPKQLVNVHFESLKGLTLSSIEIVDLGYDGQVIVFTTSEGAEYRMQHFSDCCESVIIEDISGDLEDLLHTEILMANKATNDVIGAISEASEKIVDTATLWTFYQLATIKGYVTIRWFGSSNGYYSIAVSFNQAIDI
jgi:hypothetical protein